MKFKKKPVVIEAVQFKDVGPDLEGMPKELCLCWDAGHGAENRPHIHTLEGVMLVSSGDWIIRGVKGEVYSCKPDIFEATYEAVP